MVSERRLYNTDHQDVSNGYRDRRVCHGGKIFELRVPRSRNSNFYPMLLGVLKDQEEEAQKLVSSLYCSGLTTEQVGKIYEQFYGKHYSKSQVSRLLTTAREDVSLWLNRGLEHRYPILYIDATYVLTRWDNAVSNEAYYTVLGVREDRTREVLTVVNFPTESATNWKEVFEDIKARGVDTIDLLVCDGLCGIENNIADYNDAMVVSFGTGKTVCAGGEGGAIITNNLEFYQKLVSICQHPHRQERDCGIGFSSELALNGRIHPIAVIIANETFESGLQELEQKRKVMNEALDCLSRLGSVSCILNQNGGTFYHCPFIIRDKLCFENEFTESALSENYYYTKANFVSIPK